MECQLLNDTSGYLKFCKFICNIEMAWSRAFQKCIFYHILDIFFCKHFHFITRFCQRKFKLLQSFNFSDFKSREKELFNDVIRGWGGQSLSEYWFSSTPAGIGLKELNVYLNICILFQCFISRKYLHSQTVIYNLIVCKINKTLKNILI